MQLGLRSSGMSQTGRADFWNTEKENHGIYSVSSNVHSFKNVGGRILVLTNTTGCLWNVSVTRGNLGSAQKFPVPFTCPLHFVITWLCYAIFKFFKMYISGRITLIEKMTTNFRIQHFEKTNFYWTHKFVCPVLTLKFSWIPSQSFVLSLEFFATVISRDKLIC